ncbi:MAG TPA: type II toxin-antitoxin system VapC family toxin [Chloroflexia bacterium]|nr:type II toxin-antitoxin system VapC family toxin [Chloroflexia bacterium]
MVEPQALLDSDILSSVLRDDPRVVSRAEEYVLTNGQLQFSLISRFEILRGLKAKGARFQLVVFERFCRKHQVLPITDEIIVQASDIYADLRRHGAIIGDADILIAATALVHGMALATNNERHFSRINDLQIQNWLK